MEVGAREEGELVVVERDARGDELAVLVALGEEELGGPLDELERDDAPGLVGLEPHLRGGVHGERPEALVVRRVERGGPLPGDLAGERAVVVGGDDEVTPQRGEVVRALVRAEVLGVA